MKHRQEEDDEVKPSAVPYLLIGVLSTIVLVDRLSVASPLRLVVGG